MRTFSIPMRCAAGLAAACSFMAGQPAFAGLVNDVPSCYAANKIALPATPYVNLAYILVDRTVLLDAPLQKSALDNTLGLLTPGTKFVIAEFSAFSQGQYLNVLNTGIIETPIPVEAEGDVVASRLGSFKTCLTQQRVFAQRLALGAASSIMKGATGSLAQSDVMMALKTVSKAVMDDVAKQKTVFVVTDALENSSVTSFYAQGAVRDLDPSAELQKAKTNNLIGNFGGANVYVIGGGVMPPSKTGSTAQRNGYRDPRTIMNLKQFWTNYFTQANAQLVEFGAPALLEPAAYGKR